MDKTKLVHLVKTKLTDKALNLEKLIRETQESNSETKSSMGDKYETSREMIQQEINNLHRQLKECLEQQNSITKLSAESCTEVKLGAVAEINLGFFYVATSVGVISFGGMEIHTVSAQSPIAKAMYGKIKGEIFMINGMTQTLKNIC